MGQERREVISAINSPASFSPAYELSGEEGDFRSIEFFSFFQVTENSDLGLCGPKIPAKWRRVRFIS